MATFAEKTIRSFFKVFQEYFYFEQWAQRSGLLQRLDPRAKLILALILLVTISILVKPVLLLGLCLTLGLLALLARVKLRVFLVQGWFLVLAYTAILAAPATLNWVTAGNPVLVLFQFSGAPHIGPWVFPSTLAVTDNGLNTAILLVMRVGSSWFVTLLLLTTSSWKGLLRALRCLAVPEFLVFALSMTVRYIHLLLGIALDWYLARKSRTLRATRWRQDQDWLVAQVGTLFRRSHSLAESVYLSMVSRGFRGETRVLEEPRWRPVDLAWVSMGTGFCLLLYLVQRRISG